MENFNIRRTSNRDTNSTEMDGFVLASRALPKRTARKTNWMIGVIFLFLATGYAQATTWYVDNNAKGANNGTSWANAWTSIGAIDGLSAGDTVYFSGGSTSSSQTYTVPSGGWSPVGGSPGNPITYQTGQDSAHNGTVIFVGGGGEFLITNPGNNVTLSGNVGIPFNAMTNSPVGAQHMQFGLPDGSSNWDTVVYCANLGQSNNLTLTYISAPGHHRFVYIGNVLNGCTGLVVDHCSTHKLFFPTAGVNDDTFYLGGLGGGVNFGDAAIIHDNYIESPCNGTQGTAVGDDVFKWGQGFDCYNNHVNLYLDNGYTFSTIFQHADVFQNNAVDVRVFNNWFENIGESVWFHDSLGQDAYYNLQFYNNTITQDFPTALSGVARGLDFEPQDNGQSTFSNVLVANNTWNVPSLFVMRFIDAAAWTNCVVENNAYVNCNDSGSSQWDSTAASEIIVRNNVTAQPSDFLNYAARNLQLASTATDLIGQGVNLSSAFTTDAAGNPRPANGAWDVGAFEFGSAAQSAPLPPQNLHITAN